MGLSTHMVLVLDIPTLLSHQMHFSFALIHMQSSYFQLVSCVAVQALWLGTMPSAKLMQITRHKTMQGRGKG